MKRTVNTIFLCSFLIYCLHWGFKPSDLNCPSITLNSHKSVDDSVSSCWCTWWLLCSAGKEQEDYGDISRQSLYSFWVLWRCSKRFDRHDNGMLMALTCTWVRMVSDTIARNLLWLNSLLFISCRFYPLLKTPALFWTIFWEEFELKKHNHYPTKPVFSCLLIMYFVNNFVSFSLLVHEGGWLRNIRAALRLLFFSCKRRTASWCSIAICEWCLSL